MTDERMPPQDPRVEAFLASLAEIRGAGGPRRVGDRPACGPAPAVRPSLRLPLLAAAAGLLVVVGGAMAAGWQPPFDLVPGPARWRGRRQRPIRPRRPRRSSSLRVVAAGAPIRTEPGARRVGDP